MRGRCLGLRSTAEARRTATEDDFRSYDFGNLYTRRGQKLTIKTGMEGRTDARSRIRLNNFGGTFTFPNLEAFESGVADTYREARGEPFQRATQLDMSGFMQKRHRADAGSCR